MNPPTTPRRRSRSSSRPAPAPPCSHDEPDFKRPPGIVTAVVTLAIVLVVLVVLVVLIAKLSVLGFRWVVS